MSIEFLNIVAIDLSKLHPLIVHLPIGVLLFAGLMFGLKKWQSTKQYDQAISLALALSFVSALWAVVTGLFLAKNGDYDVDYLAKHKWLGIATTAFTLILYLSFRRKKENHLDLVLFLISIALVGVTGHFGGTLTHGADFLTKSPVQKKNALPDDLENAKVFDQIISPILEKKCVSCHNSNKQKGELLMTSMAELLKGGENGPIFDFEQPEKSEFLTRIHLPKTEKLHMPPKGKVQLNDNEIKLLEWWVQNKACDDCVVAETTKSEEALLVLNEIKEEDVSIKPYSQKQVAALAKQGVLISSASESSPFLSLTIQNEDQVSPSMIKAMKPVKKNIKQLNVSFSKFDMKLVNFIADLKNLEVLQLQQSSITDEGISKLRNLPNLKTLNVYGTQVSDNSVKSLAMLQNLERIYGWNSELTTEGFNELQDQRPNLSIERGVELDESMITKLNPPTILSEEVLFNDNMEIEIESYLKNAKTYYTTDGSEPDSTSYLYEEPIRIETSKTIQAITYKKGWKPSKITSQEYIKLGAKFKSASLSAPPKKPYQAEGGRTLIDQRKSDPDFANGYWLGYEGMDVSVVLELEEKTECKTVFVSALNSPGSWIFYPTGMEVSLSEDNKTYSKPIRVDINMDVREGTETKYFKVDVPPTSAKFVKVKLNSQLKNPSWHPEPGGPSWLFIDEVFLD